MEFTHSVEFTHPLSLSDCVGGETAGNVVFHRRLNTCVFVVCSLVS